MLYQEKAGNPEKPKRTWKLLNRKTLLLQSSSPISSRNSSASTKSVTQYENFDGELILKIRKLISDSDRITEILFTRLLLPKFNSCKIWRHWIANKFVANIWWTGIASFSDFDQHFEKNYNFPEKQVFFLNCFILSQNRHFSPIFIDYKVSKIATLTLLRNSDKHW
jgi:hypothetical protein